MGELWVNCGFAQARQTAQIAQARQTAQIAQARQTAQARQIASSPLVIWAI